MTSIQKFFAVSVSAIALGGMVACDQIGEKSDGKASESETKVETKTEAKTEVDGTVENEMADAGIVDEDMPEDGNSDTGTDTVETDIADADSSASESMTEADIRAAIAEDMQQVEAAFETARASEGIGQPLMWTLSDEDTTIYLFGTIHALPDGFEWKSSEFGEAFAAADTLVLEIDLTDQAALMQGLAVMNTEGVYPDGTTILDTLDDGEEAILRDALEWSGLPLAAVENQEPWYLSINLVQFGMVKAGMNPAAGVDITLAGAATDEGKTVVGLETFEEQIAALSSASEDEQVDALIATAATIEEMERLFDVMVSEWADGDAEGLATLITNPEMIGSEDFYDAIFTDRNARWIPKIEALLDEPGVKFVAAGAGHFVGPDSVIVMLEDKGYEVVGP